MRQRISAEELMELTPEQRERLREWWTPEIGDLVVTKHMDGNTYLPIVGFYNGLIAMSGEGWHTSAYSEKDDCLPLLSIGQCIEFLEGQQTQLKWWDEVFWGDYDGEVHKNYKDDDLIAALWQAVKAVL